MLRLLRPAVDLLDDPGVSRGRLDSAARGDLRCQQLASLEVKLAFARGELASTCAGGELPLPLQAVADDLCQAGEAARGDRLAHRPVAPRPWLGRRRRVRGERAPHALEVLRAGDGA